MIPVFAVVGQPNKGKSSIVATLAENEFVAVAPTPGTTRRAERYALSVDGDVLYELVDTPGFQRARAVLDWLEAEPMPANQRPDRVRRFADEHRGDERFADECELLTPILDGAGILYVVDGAKPYGAEYEVEMQVLRWTGRPRMALINRIGPGDHVAEWRDALGQYFSIVREFDALHADFEKRIALLRAFMELDQNWRAPLAAAVESLIDDDARRLARSAELIADCLITALTLRHSAPLGEADDRDVLANRLTEKLKDDVRRVEADTRDRVQQIYQHARLARSDDAAPTLGMDLFTREGWEIFGLSRGQLVWTGVVSGALAGGSVDLVLGGASMLFGAGLGALVGGAGTWLGGDELAKVRLLGQSLGGAVLEVGPVASPNFPWVLLGRARLHHGLVRERNHARREALQLSVTDGAAFMDSVPDALRKPFVPLFKRLAESGGDEHVRRQLAHAVTAVLKAPLGGSMA